MHFNKLKKDMTVINFEIPTTRRTRVHSIDRRGFLA